MSDEKTLEYHLDIVYRKLTQRTRQFSQTSFEYNKPKNVKQDPDYDELISDSD